MLQNGAAVNATSQEGITPLFIAVSQGRLDFVKLLLQHGADPNLASKGGCRPLMIAARNGNEPITEALLTSGADPNAQLDNLPPGECTCVAFVAWNRFSHDACYAPLNSLAIAAERGHIDVVETLLAQGADVNLPIVHHAHGRLPTKREQRRRELDHTPDSSDAESDLDTESWEGRISVGTALTWARGEVRDLLLRHGADAAIEKAPQRCECPTIHKRKQKSGFGRDSDDDYPTDEASGSDTDLPWRRRQSFIRKDSDGDSS
ncbi:ankyrin repeat-containing protein [Colletotrichum chrysophilum]|uniref:Ankyrin repeat-containing protein n=1 Tax=Colletotrichum chrysophilum TaxID=1836956 RepID=A0AAD9B0F6_9PEZI|nr:ankyrin repeat-containing protein [Colletotrichum chrysophilum]